LPTRPATVSVVVRNAAGSTMASGNATKTPSTTGTHAFACTPAQLPDLGVYTATWSATVAGVAVTPTTQVEVVSAHLFGIDELRARRVELENTGKYPSTLLAAKRSEVSDWFEDVCGVAFVQRRRRRVLTGDGTDTS